ncbi:WG repeat-containing protein [Algoriphagus sp. H41]|uniref:WG repeat-containing protein n=1 Tax=Algoriphagus oliviformis TaxID=2811231 RepID=A0ABS3C500_9BACT|nr:WG repeat-containing protein [Algoriphagus oliviformis]MBN7812172.1 WG repeat-containing protein [Algoriphagus oliviformis]
MISPSVRRLLLAAAFSLSSNLIYSQTWEVYDPQGKLKSRAIYDRIEVLSESVIIGKNEKGLAMLSRDLKPVVDLQGEEVYQYLAPWILVKGPKGIGAFHEYGQQALALEYEEIQTYFNFLLGKKGGEYWLFEKGNGKTTALGKLDDAKLTHHGMLITQKNGNFYLPLSKDPERPYEMLSENKGNYLLAKEATGFGIINIEGDYVMDPVVDQLEHTKGDYFYGFDQNQYLLIKGDEVKSDVAYNSYHRITKEGDLMLEYIHGKLRRVMEEDGILLDAVGMESVELIGDNLFNVRFRENKLGLLGKKGWQVQPTTDIEWIKAGTEGLFPAGKKGLSGFVNSSGSWVVEPRFAETGQFSEQISKYRNTVTWGLMAFDGRIIQEPKWDEIKDFSAGIAIAKTGGEFHLLNKNGEVLNESGFDKVCRLKEGYFLVEKAGKQGLLDQSGSELLPLAFENIQVENPDFMIVKKDGLVGAINIQGEVIIPVNYQEIVADWSGNQVLAKELYQPVVIQIEEPQTGKRKKGA